MKKGKSQSINILETPFSTVTSNGHWFRTTRSTVETHMAGLLKLYSFEQLIFKTVLWIDSANSFAMLLYLGLAFILDPWLAAGTSIFFHYIWHHYKNQFVNVRLTPVLTLINKDLFQLIIAVIVLSYFGITGEPLAAVLGMICFFLFKVGLLRMLWEKFQPKDPGNELLPNDRIFKEILIRYSLYHNLSEKDIKNIDKHVRNRTPDLDET